MSQISDDDAPVNPAPYEPTADDLADYGAWCREREARRWADRLDAPPTFLEKFYALANRLIDDADDDLHGLGVHLGALADEARSLEAKSWGQFLDRRDAARDSGP